MAGAALAALAAITALLFAIPTPYHLVMPGPVTDVQRLITPYPGASGALLLTTVYSDPASAAEWLFGKASPRAELVPMEEARPANVDERAHQRLLAAMMDESRVAAQVVALRAAGYDVRITGQGARVHDVVAGGPAAGHLQAGDTVVGVNDREITTGSDLGATIQHHLPGDTITLHVHREGATYPARSTRR